MGHEWFGDRMSLSEGSCLSTVPSFVCRAMRILVRPLAREKSAET